MKFVKTATANRGTYTYTFIDIDGECKNVELVPGKDGVTAADIKMLHSMDDAEVYNNIKNCKPAVQDWEKPAIEDWKDKPSCWQPGEALCQVRGGEAWVEQFCWGLGPPKSG